LKKLRETRKRSRDKEALPLLQLGTEGHGEVRETRPLGAEEGGKLGKEKRKRC